MSKDKGLTAAALKALENNDLENFIVAVTPGGIEAQEAAGQAALAAHGAKLPKEIIGATREEFAAATGVLFGDDADDIFVNVTLPPGWKIAPTWHSMWSDLLDNEGRKRAAIFYKAAFYDRSAHMSLERAGGRLLMPARTAKTSTPVPSKSGKGLRGPTPKMISQGMHAYIKRRTVEIGLPDSAAAYVTTLKDCIAGARWWHRQVKAALEQERKGQK